jgi:Uma2 family endonuclease
MGMPHAADAWTADRVRALPDDGRRYELIDGELVVTPAPRVLHQVAISTLERLLYPVLAGTRLLMLHSPADISLGDDEILQPDLFVYRTPTGRHLLEWTDITSLVLVIEVLSPSTARYDRGLKRRRYQRAGVPEYWIVDLDARVIERWRPTDERPKVLIDVLHWSPGEGAALQLAVAGFFAELWGDQVDPPPGAGSEPTSHE